MAWEVRGVPTSLIKEMSSRTSGGRATSVSALYLAGGQIAHGPPLLHVSPLLT